MLVAITHPSPEAAAAEFQGSPAQKPSDLSLAHVFQDQRGRQHHDSNVPIRIDTRIAKPTPQEKKGDWKSAPQRRRRVDAGLHCGAAV